VIYQRINLLDPELEPKKERFPGILILVIPLLVTLLLGFAYGYLWWRHNESASRLLDLELQEESLINQLEETIRVFPRKEKDARLEARIQALADEKALKLRVLETLRGKTLTNTEGFSTHLRAIASHWVDDAWLEQFEISGAGGRIRLVGRSRNAEQPTRLIRQLGNSKPFIGIAFRTFEMERIVPEAAGPAAEGEAPQFVPPTSIRFELDTQRKVQIEDKGSRGRDKAASDLERSLR
jgi:hypothetical protein